MPAAHELVQVRGEMEPRADYRGEEIARPLVALEVHDRSGEGQLLLAVIFLTGAVILWGAKDDPLGPQYPAGLEVDFYTPQDVELASGSGNAELMTELR